MDTLEAKVIFLMFFISDHLFRFLTGFLSRLERATHIDFNRDNIIGRRPDVHHGHPPICGPAPAFPHGMSYSYGYNSFYRY